VTLPAPPWSASLSPYTTLFRSCLAILARRTLGPGVSVGKWRRPVARFERCHGRTSRLGLRGSTGARTRSDDNVTKRWCGPHPPRSEEHTSELQSRGHLVCRVLP